MDERRPDWFRAQWPEPQETLFVMETIDDLAAAYRRVMERQQQRERQRRHIETGEMPCGR